MKRAFFSGVVLLVWGMAGLAAETAALPALEPPCALKEFTSTVRQAYDSLPEPLWRAFKEKKVGLDVVHHFECPPDCDGRGRLAGRFDPEKPEIVIARRVCREVDGHRQWTLVSEPIRELDRQVGHAWDWLLGYASGSESFQRALRSDGQNMPAKWADEFAHYLRSDRGRAEAFARAVGLHLQSLRCQATAGSLTEDDHEFRARFPRVIAHVGQLMARQLGLVHLVERPPARPAARPTGVAILHLDVPSGAIVTIDERPTQNRSRSRYRHFHITGLDSTRRPVRIHVAPPGGIACACSPSTDAESGNSETETGCCKHVFLRAGDVVHLSFLPPEPRPKAVPEKPVPGTTRIVVFAPPTRPEVEAPQPAVTEPVTHFDFSWPAQDDARVRCTVTATSVVFAPEEIYLKTTRALDVPAAFLDKGEFVGTVHFYDPRSSQRKPFSFSPIELPRVPFVFDTPEQIKFRLTAADEDEPTGLYEVLVAAFQEHLMKNRHVLAELEDADQRQIQVDVYGKILIHGYLYEVGQPLRMTVQWKGVAKAETPDTSADAPAEDEAETADTSADAPADAETETPDASADAPAEDEAETPDTADTPADAEGGENDSQDESSGE